MTPPNEAMLHIKAIDSDACLMFSAYTRKWYVSARIEISDGACLTGLSEHRDDPGEAVLAFFRVVKSVDTHNFSEVVVCTRGQREHYRWNGAAFVAEPVEVFTALVKNQ